MPEFKSARLKIKRANEHILDANERIEDITSPDSQTIWIEVDAEAKFRTVYYQLEKLGDLPDVALVVGDAIHNLRTALDYSWIEIVRALMPSKVGKYTKFPIRQNIEDLEAGLKSHSIDTLQPRLFRFMISDIKPYLTGNDMLVFLHDMDIMDKHKLLIPTTNYGSVNGVKLRDDSGTIGSWGGEMGQLTRLRVPIHRQIEETGSVSFGIVFDEGPLKFLEVAEMLRIFSVTVSDIVARLERFLGDI